jgi:hypothetical protein
MTNPSFEKSPRPLEAIFLANSMEEYPLLKKARPLDDNFTFVMVCYDSKGTTILFCLQIFLASAMPPQVVHVFISTLDLPLGPQFRFVQF